MHDHGKECVCPLCSLDKATAWEQPRDVPLPSDDEDGGDSGMAGVPASPHLRPLAGGAEVEVEDTLDSPVTVPDILRTVRDMNLNGEVEDFLVVVNTPDGEQMLMTTLDRNDHIIGMLSVATMNWWGAQIGSQNLMDEED